MKCLIIDNKTSYLKHIISIITAKFPLIEIEIIKYDKVKLSNIKNQKYDFIILSGGKVNITNNKKLEEEIRIIKNSNIPLFGICAGFQIICFAYNIQLNKHKPIQKFLTIKIHKEHQEHPLINGLDKIKVYEDHYACVNKTSKEFITLARSNCVELIAHKSKQLYGSQFHPEKDFSVSGATVLNNFLKNIVQQI